MTSGAMGSFAQLPGCTLACFLVGFEMGSHSVPRLTMNSYTQVILLPQTPKEPNYRCVSLYWAKLFNFFFFAL